MTAYPVAPVEPVIRKGERFGRLLLLPMLAAATALSTISVAAGIATPGRFWFGLAVSVPAALWSLLVVLPSNRRGTRWRWVAFVGHLAFAAVLVEASGWYGIYAFGGYLLADLLPRRALRPAMVVTAPVLAAAQIGGYPTDVGSAALYAGMCGVNITLVTIFVALSDRIIDQNERLATALAENAGLHAQLVAQAREAGVLDERQRLAGEIHDTVAQGLIGVVTQLEAAEQARHLPDVWQRHIAKARELARANLADARRSVRALRPEQLEQADLPTALRALVRDRPGTTRVQLEVTGTPHPLPDAVGTALFRAAQEGLANVAKHASAAKVHVTLTFLDHVVVLDVLDDGVGFDPTSRADGYGLTGMRHRVEGVGGRLSVETAPGDGVALSATVPT